MRNTILLICLSGLVFLCACVAEQTATPVPEPAPAVQAEKVPSKEIQTKVVTPEPEQKADLAPEPEPKPEPVPSLSRLSVRSVPDSALLTLVDKDQVLAQGEAVLLPAGTYTVQAKLKGFQPGTQEVVLDGVTPGEILIQLEKIPTHGPVWITPSREKANLLVDGKAVGRGKIKLNRIRFGSLNIEGIEPLTRTTRWYGTVHADHQSEKGSRLSLPMTLQRKYKGQWLEGTKALALEQADYNRKKVRNPVMVTLNAGPELLTKIRASGEDAQQNLFKVMRPGDRIRIQGNDGTWILWKRTIEMDEAFLEAMENFTAGIVQTPAWKSESPAQTAKAKADPQWIAQAAFLLHHLRSPLPLVDLEPGQLKSCETIYRSVKDKELTLLAKGGAGLNFGPGVPVVRQDDFVMANIPAGASPLEIKWNRPPNRLLVVSDTPGAVISHVDPVQLQIHDKEIINLGPKAVKTIIRMTRLPDTPVWDREEISALSPLGVPLDLSFDEIGPHDHQGQYIRSWIVRYKDGAGTTQRQLTAPYAVGEQVREGRTDIFFRRKESVKK